jgi:hypothetical protein
MVLKAGIRLSDLIIRIDNEGTYHAGIERGSRLSAKRIALFIICESKP